MDRIEPQSRKRVRRDEQGGPPRKRGRAPLTQEELAQAVKVGQRASRAWGEAWKRWVNAQSYSPGFDPALWDPEELRKFFHEVGEFFVGGDSGPPPERRERRPPSGRKPTWAERGPKTERGPRYAEYRKRPSPRPRSIPHPSELNNFGINHKDANGKIVCFDWLNGRCRWGSRCKFSHQSSAGELPHNSKGAPASHKMVKFVKHGQAVSEDFKHCWSRFTMDHGGGTRDPSKHQSPFFVGYLLCFGLEKITTEGWADEYIDELMEVGHPILANAINKVRRESNEVRDSWERHCDTARGTMDPIRHSPGSLFQFFEQIGLKNYGEKGMMELIFDAAGEL